MIGWWRAWCGVKRRDGARGSGGSDIGGMSGSPLLWKPSSGELAEGAKRE